MTYKISPIGLQNLLDGRQIDIVGSRETIGIELDDNALAMAVDRRLPEICKANESSPHGLHL